MHVFGGFMWKEKPLIPRDWHDHCDGAANVFTLLGFENWMRVPGTPRSRLEQWWCIKTAGLTLRTQEKNDGDSVPSSSRIREDAKFLPQGKNHKNPCTRSVSFGLQRTRVYEHTLSPTSACRSTDCGGRTGCISNAWNLPSGDPWIRHHNRESCNLCSGQSTAYRNPSHVGTVVLKPPTCTSALPIVQNPPKAAQTCLEEHVEFYVRRSGNILADLSQWCTIVSHEASH